MDERLNEILRTHLSLGKHKPVSYLPIQTIETVLGMSVDQYVQAAENRGLQYRVFSSQETCIKSGAVYVYEPTELQNVLALHAKLIRECGWPGESLPFVCRIAVNWLEEENKMLAVVRAAFGEDN